MNLVDPYCGCGGYLIVVHRDVYGVICSVCMRWPGFWDVGVLLFVVYPFPVCSLHFGFLSSNLITGRYLSSVRVYCSIDAVQYVRDPGVTYTSLVIWFSTIIAQGITCRIVHILPVFGFEDSAILSHDEFG